MPRDALLKLNKVIKTYIMAKVTAEALKKPLLKCKTVNS